MLIHGISNLADKELLQFADHVAEAQHLSTVFADGTLTQVFISLLALCNYEQVVRTLPLRHASHPGTAMARRRQPRRRPTPAPDVRPQD
jgi:hypothetical protein